MIEQGEIYWVNLPSPIGSAPGYRHPAVVIQNNLLNRTRINTTVVCILTTNLRRARQPGNVLLNIGEGNLPRQSVVNVSQIVTIDKARLTERIGRLSSGRVEEVIAGVKLVVEPRELV